MKIKFCGAAGEVTGSSHLFEVNGKKILIDCGLYQGRRKEAFAKNQDFLFDPKEIDAVILTHAHIDHSGRLPSMVKLGFHGPIYTTLATADLCSYMLRDSAYIQEKETVYLNEKRSKKGETLLEPLYTMDDAEETLSFLNGVNYNKPIKIVPGVMAYFKDAGHILGSATITFEVEENGEKKTVVFTGDLGRRGLPILRDPEQIKKADYLITESTYGDRFHESIWDADKKLAEIINKTAARGGKVIIPAFALERTQEIIYHLHDLWNDKKIPEIPIFVDSPLAVNVTQVFKRHPECYDNETNQEFAKENPFGFERLKYTQSVDESKSLNFLNGPAIIISAAGMCEHGRILHHLRNNIEDHRNTVLIVGYMAENTLGRKLIEKQREVKIFGQSYQVKCEVSVIDAFSAHADRSDLIEFATHIEGLKKTFLVHGESSQLQALKKSLAENKIDNVYIPILGEEVEL